MGLFYGLVYSHPLLALAQGALTIWMLADAYRRGAEYFWFWIILLFQPLGAWAYFIAVKLHDFRDLSALPWFQRRASLDELRFQADKMPTLASHLALAKRLVEEGSHKEAVPHLEAALAREPDHCQVLYGLAICYAESGELARSVPYLERILERDRRWSDYSAMRFLVTVRMRLGDVQGALTAAREVARLAPTLEHQCLLAERLIDAGLADEARGNLEQALQTHRYAPSPARRRSRRWARKAQQILARIAAPVASAK